MKLTIDMESRSTVDIRKRGAWVYADHPTTEISCIAAKADNGSTLIWIAPYFAKLIPIDQLMEFSDHLLVEEDLVSLIQNASTIEAHNAGFERAMYENICVTRSNWPEIPVDKWRCSAAKAAAHSLPRSLEGAGSALGLDIQKDAEGHRIMLKLCKPRKPRKAEKEADPDWESKLFWHEDPEDYLKLFRYCIRDVDSEHAISETLRDLSVKEQKIWHLDQEINARGVYIDIDMCYSAIEISNNETSALNLELAALTNGTVATVKQVAKLKTWAETRGVAMPNLAKATVEEYLAKASTLPKEVKRALELRQALGLSSVAKYQAMINRASTDGRARGILMYHGARTGRWTGLGIQVHNLPRGKFKNVDTCGDLIREQDGELIQLLFGGILPALSTCIRSAISSPTGSRLICSDFSSIEARILAWLADEQIVLEAFMSGKDLYKVAAMAIFNCEYSEVTGDQRQIGKVAVLALGYQGGVAAFQSMAINYGVTVEDEIAKDIVDRWREKHAKIKQFWYDMESCARKAIKTGKVVSWGNIRWGTHNHFLCCRLPSGRVLSYYRPALMLKKTPWGENKEVVTFLGVNGVTRKWERDSTYGGKLAENITQAVARDVMTDAMLRVRSKGYKIVFTVHDEIIVEAENGFGSVEEIETLMSTSPSWAADCPIEAKGGWEGKRYRK